MTVSLAPFVPSQPKVVKRMLEIAEVNTGDVVFDLGCGDGRILISAVKDFGALKAVGYEMRENLYKELRVKLKREALEDRIHVFNNDLLSADISEATIITLYLTTTGNNKLKPKFSKEAKQGTKIVSHDFDFTGWYPSQKENFGGHTIYLYTIPEAIKCEKERKRFSFSFRKRF